MKRVLIAANSPLLTAVISEYLSDSFEIAVCHTGQDAVLLLHEFCPDVLAVDLMLSGIDGVGVLKTAQSLGVGCRAVAFSTYISGYMTAVLEQMEISALIRMPCAPEFLASRIRDVGTWQMREDRQEVALRNLLTQLGFHAGQSSYPTVKTCLVLYLSDRSQRLVPQLYPAAAVQLGSTPKQVERAVSRAVDAAWKCRDEQLWKRYFSTDHNGKVKRPSNAQFFAVIAGHLVPWADNEANTATG